MANFNKLSVINSVLLLGVITLLIMHLIKPKQDSIVYVDNIKLFNGFHMTQDIKTIEETKINKHIKILDSLYLRFNSLTENEKKQVPTKSLQQEIAMKSKQLQKLKDVYKHDLNVKVWKRLNNYIETYAEAKGYHIILGTNGNGNVMYANKGINITDDILEFSNRKYEGK